MRIFVSYKLTGEDPAEIQQMLSAACDALSGHEVVCTFFQEQVRNLPASEAYAHCLRILDEPFDALLAIVHAQEESRGMLLEIEKARSRDIPVLLAIQKGVGLGHLRKDAKRIIEFSHHQELEHKLRML